MIQVNLPLIFCIMKSRSCHNSTKKGFMIFFLPGRYGLSSSAIKTHPPPMRDIIFEQPLMVC